MTSQRLRFLASLSERLESDLAARERNRDDDPSPLARLEHTGLPGGHEPAPEDEVAGDEIVSAPGGPAAPIETEEDARSGAVPPPQHGRVPLSGAFLSGEGESTLRPSVPWSETGMPLRLREAIASVRRVSNEMQDVPPDDYAARGPEPYRDHAGYPNDPWDDQAADRAPPPDSQALLEPDPAPEDREIHPGHHAAYDEPPPQDELELLDEAAGFRYEPMPLDHGAIYDEPPADDDLVLLEDDAVREDRPPGFGGPAGHQEPSPDDEPSGPDEDEAYRHRHMRPDDDAVYEERAPADAAAHEHLWLDGDGADPEAAPGRGNAPHERPALRRGATTGYGVHAAAFAIAIAVVALAGFGLGILSGAGEVGEPVARGTVRAAPPQPAPLLTGQNAQRPEREKPAELSELITERVAPAQVAAVPGPPPAPRVSSSALPLPPPPKPVLRQSAAAQPASTDEEPARAVDAAAAPLEPDGLGGPFEPLFAKLPASGPRRTQIFVHYTASAVGAPATAMHLVRRLKSEGFAAEARPVEFAIPTNSIRYFFESDREQAEALRASLEGQLPAGAATSVTDFTSYEPKPHPGLIEIWLRA
jgi:hypothetical protein